MPTSPGRRVPATLAGHRGVMETPLTVALVAHDECRDDIVVGAPGGWLAAAETC